MVVIAELLLLLLRIVVVVVLLLAVLLLPGIEALAVDLELHSKSVLLAFGAAAIRLLIGIRRLLQLLTELLVLRVLLVLIVLLLLAYLWSWWVGYTARLAAMAVGWRADVQGGLMPLRGRRGAGRAAKRPRPRPAWP